MPNVEEIKSIVKLIEAEPEGWDQEGWVQGFGRVNLKLERPVQTWRGSDITHVSVITEDCATACCVAGHAIMRAGYGYRDGEVYELETGKYIGYVEQVATNLLGLDSAQADKIFSGSLGLGLKTHRGRVNRLKKVITEATGITFE